jgi:hypothetical protein
VDDVGSPHRGRQARDQRLRRVPADPGERAQYPHHQPRPLPPESGEPPKLSSSRSTPSEPARARASSSG